MPSQVTETSPFFCAPAANQVMQAQESGGHIINIGSVAALRPSPGTAAYAAALERLQAAYSIRGLFP